MLQTHDDGGRWGGWNGELIQWYELNSFQGLHDMDSAPSQSPAGNALFVVLSSEGVIFDDAIVTVCVRSQRNVPKLDDHHYFQCQAS